MNRNVLRLAIAQALAGANASVIYATGAIIGAELAPNPSLATAPISVFVVGMAAGTLPAGAIARSYGRRAAFIAGTGCGVVTGLLAALAIVLQSFPLFMVATFLGGAYAAVVQSFRFAAADGATAERRPRALSYVMVGGVFAGVLGPQLVTATLGVWPVHLFAASYLVQAGVALVSMAVLAGVDLPRPPPAPRGEGQGLGTVLRQPKFLVAVACGVVSYTVMNFLMTSAPLAMRMCGLPLSASNTALEWHIVAMYAPSFFTGKLIARFGAPRIVATGFLLLIAAAATGLSGQEFGHFSASLVLLGLGWNFGFVGASAMVLEARQSADAPRVQALNDFLVFGTMAVGSFASGGLLTHYGWPFVATVAIPPVVVALLLLAVTGRLARGAVAARAG